MKDIYIKDEGEFCTIIPQTENAMRIWSETGDRTVEKYNIPVHQLLQVVLWAISHGLSVDCEPSVTIPGKEQQPRGFRDPTPEEREIISHFVTRYKGETDEQERMEEFECANVTVLDYVPDCPGTVGKLVFIVYGGAINFFETAVIKDGKCTSLAQADDFMWQSADEKDVFGGPMPGAYELALINLRNAIPGQTEDKDWWPDELRAAMDKANELLNR